MTAAELAAEEYDRHDWDPNRRRCECGDFFEASREGNRLHDLHRMQKALDVSQAERSSTLAVEKVAEVIEGARWEANGDNASSEDMARAIVAEFGSPHSTRADQIERDAQIAEKLQERSFDALARMASSSIAAAIREQKP